MGLFSAIGAAGGALFGGVGASVGGALGGMIDGSLSKRESTEMDDYTAYKIQQEKEWDAMYGPIEKNLVSYYEHLNANSYVAKGNDILEQQYKGSMDRVNKELAARGLDTKGGVSTSIMADSLNMLAKSKSELQLQADDYVAQQQQQFYASMKSGKPDTSKLVSANQEMNAKYEEYDDKMLSAGIASGVKLGTDIFNGAVDAGMIDADKIKIGGA